MTTIQVLTRSPRPKAVVFDWDDTIFTGMRVWIAIQRDIVAGMWSVGKRPSEAVLAAADSFVRQTAGMTDLQRFGAALEKCTDFGVKPTHDAGHYVDGYKLRIEDYISSVIDEWSRDPHKHILPGVIELVKALKEAGLPLYVATANHILVKYDMVGRFGLRGYFDGVYGVGSDGFDVYDKCAAVKMVSGFYADRPGDVVMIGDGVGDIKAAKGAGAYSVGVSADSAMRERLEAAGADMILSDFEDLGQLLDGLSVR